MVVKNALVVDDSRSARIMLSKMLQKNGLDVDSVESGFQAIEYLEDHSPDVIFMDHMMPGMDGLQATQKIVSTPKTHGMPVVMYTSKEGDDYLAEAKAHGACAILPKPANWPLIAKILQTIEDQVITEDTHTSDQDLVEMWARDAVTEVVNEAVNQCLNATLNKAIQKALSEALTETKFALKAEINHEIDQRLNDQAVLREQENQQHNEAINRLDMRINHLDTLEDKPSVSHEPSIPIDDLKATIDARLDESLKSNIESRLVDAQKDQQLLYESVIARLETVESHANEQASTQSKADSDFSDAHQEIRQLSDAVKAQSSQIDALQRDTKDLKSATPKEAIVDHAQAEQLINEHTQSLDAKLQQQLARVGRKVFFTALFAGVIGVAAGALLVQSGLL